MSAGTAMLFELSGGPGCGALVELRQEAAEMYLLTFPVAGTKQREVWSYRFANRCARKTGAWILELNCFIGLQGDNGSNL